MWFFRKRKKKRPSSATSSGSWRRVVWPGLWGELQKQGFVERQIKEVFSLAMAVSNEQQLAKLNALLDKPDLRKLSRVNHDLPFDFDEVHYDLIRVFYLEANGECCLGLCEEVGYSELKILRVVKIEPIDLDKFPGRQLIYPV